MTLPSITKSLECHLAHPATHIGETNEESLVEKEIEQGNNNSRDSKQKRTLARPVSPQENCFSPRPLIGVVHGTDVFHRGQRTSSTFQ